MIKIGVISTLVFILYIVSLAQCNKYIGQFFASSDMEKTLVYLNNTLFVERLDQRTHKHVQYKQNNFSLYSKNDNIKTPAYGIIYDQFSLVSKDMQIFAHKINYSRMTLDLAFTLDLKLLCEDNQQKQIQFDDPNYCSQNIQEDYITYLHAYFNVIFISTKNNQFILNIDELLNYIQKLQLANQKISIIQQEPLLQSLISYEKFQISDKYCQDCIQGVQFFIKNQQYVILKQNSSLRNQIILPYNLTSELFAQIEGCENNFDFDMTYEQKGPKIDKGYFVIIRCNQRIKLLKIKKESIEMIDDQNLNQNMDKSVNSVLLYDYSNQHIYGFYNDSLACFYSKYESSTKSKFLNNENQNTTNLTASENKKTPNYHICLKNQIPSMTFSHVLYNDQDNKVTIILSKTDKKYTEILGQLIDKCSFFNLKESIECNLCSQCSNSCASYNLEYCGGQFMFFRFNTFLALLILALIALVGLILKQLPKLIKECLKLTIQFIVLIFCHFPIILCNLIKKFTKAAKIKCRKFKIKVKNIFHRIFKSKSDQLNNQNEDICPICMDTLSARPIGKFVCNNHSAHLDCLEEYNTSKINNNQDLDCPFRDTAESKQNIQMSEV
ncbi:transmembrane protein, putative (macronuclear) [Tetrahymena thermophila SB210]|uniref:Transmembrane protein, putative n=1 Tax=Tetrahymena thermophila (strain SB210) TaxID=312017 RepID=Q22CT2_TETTS|nr:transmembrane protein, putative [Tetrahymena thermophila SB210]EAR83106.2 transmembrane protein, putative [Tetrahymena thermophila SB210]|eukprot:XP_001030769.2 transmembrane protein, putative [Tetrahymena thermophila SB210]